MPVPYSRLTETRRWVTILAYLAIFAGVAVIVVAMVSEGASHALPYLVAGVAMIIAGGMFSRLSAMVLKMEDHGHRIHELLIEARNVQDKHISLLETIRDNSRISDAAKSITHRELERDALRRAIREDIVKEDWEAAYSLIDEMERRFGYRLEAYNYRKEVDEFRAKVIEDKLQVSMRHVRRLVQDQQWDEGGAEAERLLKLAPEDPRVAEIISMLNAKRGEHKEELLRKWHDAVERKDLDSAIELVKLIDPFLTRDEAAKLSDTARSVFKAKLLDHAAQFSDAVTEKKWDDAIRIGGHIRSEFPNSLMAKEVSESMEALKAKAAKAAAASSG